MSLSSGSGKKAAMAIYCDAEQNNSHDDCLRPNTSPFKRQSGNGAPTLFNAWSTSTHQKQRRRAVATRPIRVPNNTRSTSQSSHTRTQQYFALCALGAARAPWPDGRMEGRVFHSAHNHGQTLIVILNNFSIHMRPLSAAINTNESISIRNNVRRQRGKRQNCLGLCGITPRLCTNAI
jgi:hypothetical protein